MEDPERDQGSDSRIDSDADSDLEDLQHDIDKLNNSVREFLASQRQERPYDILEDNAVASQEPVRQTRGSGIRRGTRGPRKAAKPRGDITARLAKVNQAFLAGEYVQALDLAFEVIRINAETHQAWTTVASIFREQGQLNRALSAMVYAAHLRPRDVSGWLRCADFALDNIHDDEAGNLHTARLCYSAAIKADPLHVEARLGKAAICERQGHLATAAAEYRLVLKKQPKDLETIRKLAEVCIENMTVETAVPSAIEAYRRYFDAELGVAVEDAEERWHDVGVYTELFVSTRRWPEAIKELKRLCRWLFGRAEEGYWDNWQADDREWDLDDERRNQVPEYMAEANAEATYVLPLDYRARLAIYRLRIGDLSEATHHLTWLEPNLAQTAGFVVDYPFLVYDIAVELSSMNQQPQAIQYLLLLRALPDDPDPVLLLVLGRCYLSTGQNAAAEECFLSAIEADSDNIEARVQLAGMYERAKEDEDALVMAAEAMALRDAQDPRSRQRQGLPRSTLRPLAPLRPKEPAMVVPNRSGAFGTEPKQTAMPRRYKPKRFAGLEERLQDEQARAAQFSYQYDHLRELRSQIQNGDISLMDSWLDASRDMIDDFRSVKKNYSWDKYLQYLAPKANTEIAPEDEDEQNELSQLYQRLTKALAPRMESHEGVSHSTLLKVHQGISYDDWLQLFLDYAVGLALLHRKDEAYQICESARDSNAFQSAEHNFMIHVTWGVCGVVNRDEEVCVKAARHLMKERVLSDSCRMFALITTLCQSPVSWYTSGPAQKFLLRQVKMLDARSGVELAGQDGALMRVEPVEDARLDVCILMLYGHVLSTSTSYLNALSYFFRARSLDPDNAMVNLSLGLAYVHSAMKRQAVNRQYLLLQGQVFMTRYMEVDAMAGGANRMEVLFNLGRLHQLVGIPHLAHEYYEQALGEDRGDQASTDIRCLIYANQINAALVVRNTGRALELMKEGVIL